MKRLITFGKGFEFVGDNTQEPPPSLGDMPKLPQPVRRIKSERMAKFRPMSGGGNGYRPGPLMDLGRDQCRFSLESGLFCGVKVVKGAWCADHYAVVYGRFREAAE